TRFSKTETQPQAELAFVETFSRKARYPLNLHKGPWVSDAARRLVDGVGVADVVVGNIVVRRVGEIEGLGAELQAQPFGNGELAEHAEVPVEHAGCAQVIKSRGAEPRQARPRIVGIEYFGEREGIVPIAGRAVDLMRPADRIDHGGGIA